jgi:hypothetical protein
MSESERVIQAEQIMNTPIFKEAMTVMKADLVDGFMNTKFEQDKERLEIWSLIKTVDKFELYFKHLLTTGKLLKEQERLNKKQS